MSTIHFLTPITLMLGTLIPLPCIARDFPAEIVQYKDDAFLKGQPKFVFTQEDSSDTLTLSHDKYNESGILISHMTGGTQPSKPFETEIKKGRFIETRYSPSTSGLAPAVRAIKYDEQGRVTALKDDPSNFTSTNAITPADHSPFYQAHLDAFARIVNYEPNTQIHTIYKNRALLLSIGFYFSKDDNLLNMTCIKGNCEGFVSKSFSKDGILSTKGVTFGTDYLYEQGILASSTTLYKNGKQDEIYYGDYLFDSCGNWTQRAEFSQPPSNLLRERLNITLRKIDYYSSCTQNHQVAPSNLTCPSIITYRIGNIDKRFSLSKSDAIKITQEAASIWNKQAQRTLLQYKDDGDIPIHFVYDQRLLDARSDNSSAQQATNNAKQNTEALAKQILQKKKDFEIKVEQQQQQFSFLNQQQQTLKNDIEVYTLKLNALQTVQNTSSDDIDKINQLREQLKLRELALRQRQADFNINSQALDKEQASINQQITELKAIFDGNIPSMSLIDKLKKKTTKDKEFHIGTYQTKGTQRWIDIYSVSDDDLFGMLKQTLVHELGHALGLPHSEDKAAVMYYKTGNNDFNLSTADSNMLYQLCPVKN